MISSMMIKCHELAFGGGIACDKAELTVQDGHPHRTAIISRLKFFSSKKCLNNFTNNFKVEIFKLWKQWKAKAQRIIVHVS